MVAVLVDEEVAETVFIRRRTGNKVRIGGKYLWES